MTLAALDFGAHILCETPMAMNADEAWRMLEKAESLKRIHSLSAAPRGITPVIRR